jgi:hypothetical protein
LDNNSFKKFIYHKRFVYKIVFVKSFFFPENVPVCGAEVYNDEELSVGAVLASTGNAW